MVKESAHNMGDPGAIPGFRRCPGEGNSNPLQYSCLENSIDRGAWRAIVFFHTNVCIPLNGLILIIPVSSVQVLSCVQLFVTPWTTAIQASLYFTNSQSCSNSCPSVMPSNHLILCHPLLLPPSIFPSIRVRSNESVRHIR